MRTSLARPCFMPCSGGSLMAGELSVQAAELAIGEVSRRSGQTVVTLRHWESMGLLPPPPRIGGKRRYPAEILTRIAMIDLLRRCAVGSAPRRLANFWPFAVTGVRQGARVERCWAG